MSRVSFNLDERETPSQAPSRSSKKRVTIQTPPASPDETPRRQPLGHRQLNMDQASVQSDLHDNVQLNFDTLDMSVNSSRNMPSYFNPPQPAPSLTGSKAPTNPFLRTLATTEGAYNRQQLDNGDEEVDARRPNIDNRPNGQTYMDVDTFKNILLTGRPSAIDQPIDRSYEAQESNDRQLEKESAFEEYIYAQSESENESSDDNQIGLSEKQVSRGTAPTQSSSHQSQDTQSGSKGPQTVSFADFEHSLTSHTPVPSSGAPFAQQNPRPTVSKRTSSSGSGSVQSIVSDSRADDMPQDATYRPKSSITMHTPTQKKLPPPPPSSRRQGVTSTNPSRARSTSNATDDTRSEEPVRPLSNDQHSPAPQPPPPRKSRPISQIISPAACTPAQSPPLTPTEAKLPMPPPPRRTTPARPTGLINRTLSTNSHASSVRTDSISLPTASTGSKPPTPPPRRSTGVRCSIDGIPPGTSAMAWATGAPKNRRRSSASSTCSSPLTSLQQQTVAEQAVPIKAVHPEVRSELSKNDVRKSTVLDDLSAFQAEIDALREEAERRQSR